MEAILSRLLINQPQLRQVLKLLFIGLILTGLVFALIPTSGMDIKHFDKILHAAAFFGFAFLLDMASPRSFWRWKVPVLLFYGASIEILQLLTPWRSFSVADFVADSLGVLLYWLLWRMVMKYFISHPNG